jgi:hypothetical protein
MAIDYDKQFNQQGRGNAKGSTNNNDTADSGAPTDSSKSLSLGRPGNHHEQNAHHGDKIQMSSMLQLPNPTPYTSRESRN